MRLSAAWPTPSPHARSGADRHGAPGAAEMLLVFVLYFVGAKFGVMASVMQEGIAILWLPNAVLLAALIRFRGAGFPAIAATGLAAEVAADWPIFTLVEAILFGAVNVAEVAMAYALLARLRFDPRLPRLGDLWRFALAGPILSALAAALAGAAIYSAFRGGATSYLEFVRIWWFGDALGVLILTPLLLALPPFQVSPPARGPSPRSVDVALWGAAAALAVGLLVAAEGLPISPVLLLPFVLYAAARYPFRWSAIAVATVSLGLVALMAAGRNPFGAAAPREAVMAAQEFILVLSLMGLGLSALLAQLRARQEEIEARVAARTAELSRANERLEQLSTMDPLTGLKNRRGLHDAAAREVAQALRANASLAVLMIDLDHFKRVNDLHGHAAGDEALKRCAQVLRRLTRGADTCARYGGEELVVLAHDTNLAGAAVLAERIRATVSREAIAAASGGFHVTASIGVALLKAGETDLSGALRRADAALYVAKSAGRNRVEIARDDG